MPIGCLLNGPLMDRYGRKTALLVLNFPCFVGWFCLASQPKNLLILYIGRLLVAISVALSINPAVVYAAECITVNYTELRGCFMILTSIMLDFGMFLTFFLGLLMPATSVAYIAAVISLISFFIICIFIPESPLWLFEQGRNGDAELSQKVLRITQPILQENKVQLAVKTSVEHSYFYVRVRDPDVYKPIFIMTTFFFLQQMSGSFVFTSYMIQILQNLNITVNSYLILLLVGLINLCSIILLSFSLSQKGFKPLLYLSCIGVSFSMIVLSVFLYLNVKNTIIVNVVILSCLFLYTTMNGLGLRPIPYAMIGEVFPSDVAGMGSSFTVCCASLFNFTAIKLYPYLNIWLGPGVYVTYGLIALLTFIFVATFLPNTKGKTLKQIGDHFTRIDKKTSREVYLN
ncbi:facilitated trehalose transporter Tret1-like isoform X2 [Daktulosphaira vitifoliae]|nr:facilitated trehalose transporter Tret1-like isoform X2 [Daktulosphaira vitifoliae]